MFLKKVSFYVCECFSSKYVRSLCICLVPKETSNCWATFSVPYWPHFNDRVELSPGLLIHRLLLKPIIHEARRSNGDRRLQRHCYRTKWLTICGKQLWWTFFYSLIAVKYALTIINVQSVKNIHTTVQPISRSLCIL